MDRLKPRRQRPAETREEILTVATESNRAASPSPIAADKPLDVGRPGAGRVVPPQQRGSNLAHEFLQGAFCCRSRGVESQCKKPEGVSAENQKCCVFGCRKPAAQPKPGIRSVGSHPRRRTAPTSVLGCPIRSTTPHKLGRCQPVHKRTPKTKTEEYQRFTGSDHRAISGKPPATQHALGG